VSRGILRPMVNSAKGISQPGWTGKVGALRIAKAAHRTDSSVDPIGHRSMAGCEHNNRLPLGSFALRFLPTVSGELCSIETGVPNWRNARCYVLLR
jgi:hypothetical protein